MGKKKEAPDLDSKDGGRIQGARGKCSTQLVGSTVLKAIQTAAEIAY